MKLLRSMVLAVLGLLLAAGGLPYLPAASAAPITGTGTADNPYVIASADHMKVMMNTQISSLLKGYYVLAADIDMSGIDWKPIGKPGAEFIGSFDGKGYAITGLKVNKPLDSYVGLFGRIKNATLKNIVLIDASVNGGAYTGGLAGASESSAIENCSVDGTIASTDKIVGGLVGYNGGKIEGSLSTGTVMGNHHVGGLVGELHTDPDIGPASIQSSYSLSDVVSRLGSDGNYIGGLVGTTLQGTVKTSFAAGSVTGNPQTSGGLFGAGGTKLGYSDTFVGNVWNLKSTGQPRGIGFLYEGGPDPAGNEGLTDEEMRQSASYPDWNFDDLWILGEGADHPVLRWQLAAMRPQSLVAHPQNLHVLVNRAASFSVKAIVGDGQAYNVTGLTEYSVLPQDLITAEKQSDRYVLTAGNRPGNGSILVSYQDATLAVPFLVSDLPQLADAAASSSQVSDDGRYESEVRLRVLGTGGQPYPSLEVSLEEIGGDTDISPASQETDDNGEAIFRVKNAATGRVSYKIAAADFQLELGAIEVDFRPGKASPVRSSIEPKTQFVVLEGAAGGAVSVALRDALGAPLAGHRLELVRSDGAPIGPGLTSVTDEEGTAAFEVANRTAETVSYRVIDLDDQVEIGSVEITFVENTADATKSDFRALPSMIVADDSTESALTLRLRNAADLPIAGRRVDLHQGNADGPVLGTETTDAEGTAVFKVKSGEIGTVLYTAVAQEGGNEAKLYTVTVDYVADEIDIDSSGYVVSGEEARADGSESVAVLVTLKDKHGNPVQGSRVEIDQTGESAISPPSALTDESGEARFTVASDAVEAVTYTVMTPKGALGDAFQIRFADFFKGSLRVPDASYRLKVGEASALTVYADYQSGEKEVARQADWRSSEPFVAFVRDGSIVAAGAGSATITLSYLGVEKDIAVTVIRKDGGANPDPGSGTGSGPGSGAGPNPGSGSNPGTGSNPGSGANPAGGTGAEPRPSSDPGSGPQGHAEQKGDGGDGLPGKQPGLARPVFTDIDRHWAKELVVKATEEGIAFGYPDGTFRPDRSVTRAEFTAMLVRALGIERADRAAPAFSDWSEMGQWAREAVTAAWQAGLAGGYGDGSFRPGAEIKRVEMTAMIVRALGDVASSNSSGGKGEEASFADEAAIPAWARNDVALARQLGLTQGRGNNRFDPLANATRAEAVAMLMKLPNVVGT